MRQPLIRFLKKAFSGIITFCALFAPTSLHAWTSAHLFDVEVHVAVARTGPSVVTTEARFVVEGGYFHGFDMVNLPNGTLVEEAGVAILDDKRTMPVVFKYIKDGRIRVLLADDRFIRKGGITFQVVHRLDLVETGAISRRSGRARLDFTPLVWDVGLDAMTLTVELPKGGRKPPVVDAAVAKDYVIHKATDQVTAVKYRPVKWYPMQLIVAFDAALVEGIAAPETLPEKTDAAIAAAADTLQHQRSQKTTPVVLYLLLLSFLGLVVLYLKARHVAEASRVCGVTSKFALLSHTAISVRILLAASALSIGVAVQWAGYLAAGIPAVATAAALFILKRETVRIRPRPGGSWHKLSDGEIERLAKKLSRYRKSRRSFFDVTTGKGFGGFVVYVALLGFLVIHGFEQSSEMMWAALINGIILGVPVWFGSVCSELPVDPLLEGFGTLKKWQRSLSKLLGTRLPGVEAAFYLREDLEGPIEVRLKTDGCLEGLRHIEVAGEIFRTGTLHRTRTVFVLRLEPGAAITRKLAACPGAAEHHLTPDLQEEIIVLRNRRNGAGSGLTPLRSALTVLHG